MNKPHFSNLTDQALRNKISKKEEELLNIESKPEKSNKDLRQLKKIRAEIDLLIEQTHIPFRLTNTIWFNRLNSIFFSVKNTNPQPI